MRMANPCVWILCLMICGMPTTAVRAESIRVEPIDPQPIRITIDDLPEPYATESVNKQPKVVEPPEQPVLKAPRGFRINVFAEVDNARWLALTPEGEVLCAASRDNRIVLLPDTDSDGVADSTETFLDESHGARLPFGMAFADEHFYLGNTDAVLRYPYEKPSDNSRAGRLGEPEQITSLPGQGYNQHWTRNVVAAPDGKHLYVSVGSESNADVEPLPRASILRIELDGSAREVFATGLRNPVGLDFHPETKALYATVNERDKLGDGLVPDYLAQVNEGEFYGWPYAYLTPDLLDPRHTENGKSVRPELVAKTHTPDVLIESHAAALGLAFYDKTEFPSRYHRGAFIACRGSWNRDRGVGYKVIFVPFDDGEARDYYEDFVTGFLLDPAGPTTWGRPVGVLVHPDGSLLFTEEANGRVYRVSYMGE